MTTVIGVLLIALYGGLAMALWEGLQPELAARRRLRQLRRIDDMIARKEGRL